MTTTKLTTILSALLLLGMSPPALAQGAAPAATDDAQDSGPGVVIAEEHAPDSAVPRAPAPTPPWAVTLRAGAFVLRSPGIPGHPAGPDVEVSLGRTVYDLVSVEVNAGHYGANLTGTGTSLSVVPLSVSLKVTAAPEHGVEPYAVAGLGASLTQLSGGSLGANSSVAIAFHAGLGARYLLNERFFTGLDARYVFQDVAGAAQRLDGLRLSVLGGAVF